MILADLFDLKPEQWGLRGDPFLWEDMRSEFEYDSLRITYKDFEERLIEVFEEKTNISISDNETVYIEKYAHGGMSSGQIDVRTWRERLIPMLVFNYEDVKVDIKDE